MDRSRASTPEQPEYDALSQHSAKSSNFESEAEMLPSTSSNIKRYTRSQIIMLRHISESRKQPPYMQSPELFNLGLWKTQMVFYNSHHNSAANSTIQQPNNGKGLVVLPMINLDHRSISSSHLMPAFAKRRIASTMPQMYGLTKSASSGASDTRGDSPVDREPSSSHTGRQSSKNMNPYRQRDRDQNHSPHRKLSERDRERHDRAHDRDHGSPVPPGNGKHSHHTNTAHERRIGSGRLVPRDIPWDYRGQEKDKSSATSANEKDLPTSSHHVHQRSSLRYNDLYPVRGGFDRRRGGNNDETSREKYENMGSSSSRRFISNANGINDDHCNHQPYQSSRNRRGHYNDHNEEPEWFSGGPTSQHDTIELRGFEEIDDYGDRGHRKGNAVRKHSESSSSRASSSLNFPTKPSKSSADQIRRSPEVKNKDADNDTIVDSDTGSKNKCSNGESFDENQSIDENLNRNSKQIGPEPNERNNSDIGDNNNNNNDCNKSNDGDLLDNGNGSEKSQSNENGDNKETAFNFDAFLHLDPLDHTLMHGDIQTGNEGGSRFSRWFGIKSSNEDQQSPGESKIGHDANNPGGMDQNNTLMEFLQRSKLPVPVVMPEVPLRHAIPSVEELEARMRKMDGSNRHANEQHIKSGQSHEPLTAEQVEAQMHASLGQQPATQDVAAFKKLLDQLGSANKQQPPMPQPPIGPIPLNLLQANRVPLNMIHMPGMLGPNDMQPLAPLIIKNEEIKKLMHQQQLLQQKQIHGILPPHQYPHPPQMVPMPPPGTETTAAAMQAMLSGQPQKQLEAQHLFQCVARGEVSLGFLEQELNNPNTAPHAKEIIALVLRESSRSVTPMNLPPQQGNIGANATQSPIPMMGSLIPNPNMVISNPQMPNAGLILPGQPEHRMPPGQQGPLPAGIPSARELQFHTQAIMQNALLKKKMEEQQLEQETLKRRQEIQKQQQQQQQQGNLLMTNLNEMDSQQKNGQQLQTTGGMPQSSNQQQQQQTPQQQVHPAHTLQQQPRHVNSPTPLAFTPTSVLRKMTAEKDNSSAQQQMAINVTQGQQQQQHQQQQQTVVQQGQNKLPPGHYINQQHAQQLMQQQQQQLPPPQPQLRMILGGNPQQQLNNGGQQVSPQNLTIPSQQPAQQPVQPQVQLRNQQQQPQQQMQMKWPAHMINANLLVNKPMESSPVGRPILKGPMPNAMQPTQPQQQQQSPQQQQQLPQMTFAAKLEYHQIQQQQRLKNNQTPQHMLVQGPQQVFPPGAHPLQPQPQQQPHPSPKAQNALAIAQQQQQHQLMQQQQQQQRALVLQRQNMQIHQQLQQQQQHPPRQQAQPPQQGQLEGSNRPIAMPQGSADTGVASVAGNPSNNNNPNATGGAAGVGIINFQRDGVMSPTSNQLAQWFSPELLAQASAGKLPLLNMNQTLSLEEFERSIQHSSAAVHN